MAFLPAIPAIFAAADATAATAATAASATAATAAATAPAWLGYASLGATALSGAVGVYGALKTAQAQKNSANYNAAVANINATQAERNRELASEQGMAEQAIQQRKTRAEVGAIRANQAASGVDVNSGSALDVRSSAAELGELDAISVRQKGTLAAYGYDTQKTGFQDEASLDTQEAKSASEAGNINAATSLLGSVSTGASNYYKYQLQGGFSA